MAVIFEKQIPLSYGTGQGITTVSTTSSTYVEQTHPAYPRIDPAAYSDATFYFEAVIKTSAATGYAALYTAGGTYVTGSEVSTTSTTYARLRSGALTLSADDYTDRLKNDGTNTTTKNCARVVIVQNADAITDTETQVRLVSRAQGTTSATYVDLGTVYWGYFLYTATNFDGTVSIYFEATMKTSAATGYCQLYDATAGAGVTNSEITTTSTSYVRVRSVAITLTSGNEYKPQAKNDGTNTTSVADARIIIQQTGSPSATECYLTVSMSTHAFSSTAAEDVDHKVYYDPNNWSVDTVSFYHEGNFSPWAAGLTAYIDLWKKSDAAQLTNSQISTTQQEAIDRVRSAALTMPSTAQDLSLRGWVSAAGTQYTTVTHLLAVITWTNVVAALPEWPILTGSKFRGPKFGG